MKIGLFFGSFNPVHTGHLIIATYISNYLKGNVWFVISPQNPDKKKEELLEINDRILILNAAIFGKEYLSISTIELNLPAPSYTINTLNALKNSFEHEFYIIMGSDNFKNIQSWKSGDLILANYKLIVYQRPGFEIIKPPALAPNIKLLTAPMLNISSTEIRNLIKSKQKIDFLIPDKALKIIYEYGFYS